MSYVFITFMHKLSHEKSNALLKELRKRLPGYQFVFSPRPPAGRKTVWNIDGETVILTFPSKSVQGQQGQQGQVTLGDLMKTKSKT